MIIEKAEKKDLHIILDLQYLAYQSEAKLYNNPNIPPLSQTLDEVESEYQKGIVLKAVDENNSIIGSVRAYYDKGTVYIGKLMVHPQKQGQGIGTQLLQAIENEFPKQRYELFTSSSKRLFALINQPPIKFGYTDCINHAAKHGHACTSGYICSKPY